MTVHVALQNSCDLWALLSPFIEQLGADLLQPFMGFLLVYPKQRGRSCGWDTTGERLHKTHIDKLSWSCAGSVGHWGGEHCQGFWNVCREGWEPLIYATPGNGSAILLPGEKILRSLLWGCLCWEKILGNFLLILLVFENLERKYCLKQVSAFGTASAKRF